MTKTRSEYLAEAKDRGFQTVNRFSYSVQVVVSGNPRANTEKNRMAAALDLPVITYDEWDRLTPDGEIFE